MQPSPSICMTMSAAIAPGRAEQIVDGRVGRVIEARIGDGPGEEREAESADARQRAKAQHLGRPALRKFAQRVGR